MLLGGDFFLAHRVYVSWAQHKLYFSYNGGPIFDSTPVSTEKIAAPLPEVTRAQTAPPEQNLDADGFSRRGSAFYARREFPEAIADFTRSIELDPGNPTYPYQRALAYVGNGQPFLAMSDLDRSVRGAPDAAEPRLARAQLLLAGHDFTAAHQDLDTADRVAPRDADLRLEIGHQYERSGAYEKAVAQYDMWISSHAQDKRLGEAMVMRCGARALWGQGLQQAATDCETAHKLKADSAILFGYRGLVQLRLGEFDRAIENYGAALKLEPRLVSALYFRGVARLRKGDTREGQSDIDAATSLNPEVTIIARNLGLER
jgi:tetratricopeptide (TPR) repeat protein